MRNTSILYAIASIFFGVISVAVSMIFFISFPAAVLAITFGIFAVRKYYRKSGTIAIVLGIIGLILTIIFFVNLVQKLNVDSLIAGKWNVENGEYINFTDRGSYIWYNKKNDNSQYASGYYTLSSGVYRNKQSFVMGYTVVLKQISYLEDDYEDKTQSVSKWLVYSPGEKIVDGASDEYEMMNLETGETIKITKEKEKLFGIFNV